MLVARWGYVAPTLAEAARTRALAPDAAGVAVLLAEFHAHPSDRETAARELLRVRDHPLIRAADDRGGR